MKFGLIVGSLRKDSWNRKVAEVVKGLFKDGNQAEFIDIKNVPLYNEDDDGESPHPEYTRLRDEVRECDGYIFFTPEYNRSYAPAIKNAIDIVSKDPKGNSWAGKPALVITASQGGFGGMAANHALRQVFIFTDIVPVQSPEIYLSNIQNYFEQGKMNEDTKNFIKQGVNKFISLAEKLKNS